ncbi:MAG: magnesium-translocating P-type ATPase [Candidatus Burarchaeum sp.]|nr:magnesium-translocating P-type ATPase [Candidatus Burarchaeum sp.]MDO8339222.1 magnesium-translocating P-type ATPase [Candidatus Burarchaeum sp.]
MSAGAVGIDRPWALSAEALYQKLGSSDEGLSEQEAKHRESAGRNELPEKDRRTVRSILVSQFNSPLIYILLFATTLAYLLGDIIEGSVILVIVLINGVLGFFQEYKSEKALETLKKYITFNATVLRNGEKTDVDARALVVGDVVMLRIGNRVPADMRLLLCEEFQTNESVLTGESGLVEKSPAAINAIKPEPQLLSNMAFMGTTVASGHAVGIVTSIGADTFFGKTALTLSARVPESHFEKSIREFGNMLIKVTAGMTIFVFIVNTLLGRPLLESFLFAVALAVGITPEALPIVITIALSSGALELAKKKVVVKKLVSLEDLGNIDVFCADKTGTLSENELVLEKALDAQGSDSTQVMEYGLLCNTLFGTRKARLANAVDSAIIHFASNKFSISRLSQLHKVQVLDTVDFDHERKRMSVIVRHEGKLLMITKGAAENVFEVCTSMVHGEKIRKISQADRKKYEEYAAMGYSVIAVAVREVRELKDFKPEDEKGLTLAGFLLLGSQPRHSAAHTIAHMKKMGVELKILTGDGPIVTRKLCRDVGFAISEDRVILGEELDGMDEQALMQAAQRYNIFARITPTQKYQLVLALRRAGHVVAYLGDGVNDAPALRAADVGISVNNAVDVAKDAAHIILLNKSLDAVLTGIQDGRKIFGNVTKYILNTISANFGNMFSMAASSLFLKFLPLLPSQILLNNLLSDFPMLTISTDNVDSTFLKKPKRWNLPLISQFMIYFGVLSFVFDMLIMFSLLYWLQAPQDLFRTAWFLMSLLTEVAVVFVLRTQQSFYKSSPSRLLAVASLATVAIALAIIYLPIGRFFEFAHLDLTYLALIAGVTLLYVVVVEVAKMRFFKKHGFEVEAQKQASANIIP